MMTSEHILWTHFDAELSHIKGFNGKTGARKRIYVDPQDITQTEADIRTYGPRAYLDQIVRTQSDHNHKNNIHRDQEGFYYYTKLSRRVYEEQCLKREGVYTLSALTHHHAPHVIQGLFKSYVNSTYLRDTVTAWLQQTNLTPVQIVYVQTDTAARHTVYLASLIFKEHADYVKLMLYYLNEIHDDYPHIVNTLVTRDMHAARLADITYSQLPPDKIMHEKCVSWDIECHSSTGHFPVPTNVKDRLQLLCATFYDQTTPMKTWVGLLILPKQPMPTDVSREVEANLSERFSHPVHVHYCRSEMDIISGFLDFIESVNCTIIIGYNTSSFDTPFIVEKAKTHRRLDLVQRLTVIHFTAQVFSLTKRYDLCIKGAPTIDMFLYLRQIDKSRLLNEDRKFSLDYFAKSILNIGKAELPEHITVITHKVAVMCGYATSTDADVVGGTWSAPYLTTFIEYCIIDTLRPAELAFAKQAIISYRMRADIMMCPTPNMFCGGITNQMNYMKYAYFRQQITASESTENNYVGITQLYERICHDGLDISAKLNAISCIYARARLVSLPYSGALVYARPGVYSNVICVDAESLYPNCIREGNISPDTILVRPRQLNVYPSSRLFAFTTPSQQEYKVYIRTDTTGISPHIMSTLLSARVATQAKLKILKAKIAAGDGTDPDRQLVSVLDNQQTAYKLCANSFYGSGAAGQSLTRFDLFSVMTTAMARSVFLQFFYAYTEFAQRVPDNLALSCPGTKLIVIYGDTDSIMVGNVNMKKLDDLLNIASRAVARAFPSGYIKFKFEYATKAMTVISPKRYFLIHPDETKTVTYSSPFKIISKGLKTARTDVVSAIVELDTQIQKRILAYTLVKTDDNNDDHHHLNASAVDSNIKLNDILISCFQVACSEILDKPVKDFIMSQKVKSLSAYRTGNLVHVAALADKLRRGYAHASGDSITYLICDPSIMCPELFIAPNKRKSTTLPNCPKYKLAKYISPHLHLDVCTMTMRDVQNHPEYKPYMSHYFGIIIQTTCNYSDDGKALLSDMIDYIQNNLGFRIRKPTITLKKKIDINSLPALNVDDPHHIYYQKIKF